MSAVPHAPAGPRINRRDQGLWRVRRVTQATMAVAAAAVMATTGYLAAARPGRHLSTGATTTSSSGSSASSSSGPAGGTGPGGGGSSLAPPAAAPQPSGMAPQVISGSS